MNRVYQLLVAFFLCSSLIFAVGSVQARELNAQTNVDQAAHSVGAAGVPTLSIEGVGAVAHPAWTALYALAYAGLEDYDPGLGLKPDSVRFQSAIDWLKNNLVQDRNGLWVWVYSFDSTYNDVSIKAPWSSAFAQATGIQALLAHWKQTGDQQSLEFARKAAQALFVPLEQGGFLFRSGDDIWFEEIPEPVSNPSHILNGHMRALLALGELADATGDDQYRQWFNQGSDTLLRWLPLYDAGYWLRYDLNPRKDELLFRLANPYGFANPQLAIDRIVLHDPVTGEESVLDVGAQGDAEGLLRIAGNDWGQIEELDGRTVRRLNPAIGEKQDISSDGQMVSPHSYFYLTLPSRWADNLRKERFELTVEYFDDQPGNLVVEMRSIAPGQTFRPLPSGDLLLSRAGKWRGWKVPIFSRDLGYWVGDSYAAKHASYLQTLALRMPALMPWAEVANGYLNQRLNGDDFSIVVPSSKKAPVQTPPLPYYSLDDAGVVMQHMSSEDGGEGYPVYSPYIVASQALEGSSMAGMGQSLQPRFKVSDVRKEPAIAWLLDEDNFHKYSGAAIYEFRFDNIYNDVVTKSPWASSFGQNFTLKALSDVAKRSPNYIEVENIIARAVSAYFVPIKNGGFVAKDRKGLVFYEEVPNATHILNGHISALPVLSQMVSNHQNETANKALVNGILSTYEYIALFDTGYWLRYDLNPKKNILFQIDWLSGERSPLIESIELHSPQFQKKVVLAVGDDAAFEGVTYLAGNDWSKVRELDGRLAREFLQGYRKPREDKSSGMRHQVYMFMSLPSGEFRDYFDVQSHRLVIRYKDVAPGRFVLKIQPIHEGNILEFVPLRGGVLEMKGDNQWKTAYVELRPQDMGWYKGADYQVFEVGQLKDVADITGDWFFSQYAERHEYYLKAKEAGRPVIVEPERAAPSFSLIDSLKKIF